MADAAMADADDDEEEDALVSLAASVRTDEARGRCVRSSNGALLIPRLCCRHWLKGRRSLALIAGRYALAAEFAGYVRRSEPVILAGCVGHWPALRRWTHAYLRAALERAHVHVSMTPDGLGDAVASLPPDGAPGGSRHVFAKAYEPSLPFTTFIDAIEQPRGALTGEPPRPVLYASHQDSSLTSEYAPLWPDVETSLGWADSAFGREPSAVNFWMGQRPPPPHIPRSPIGRSEPARAR